MFDNLKVGDCVVVRRSHSRDMEVEVTGVSKLYVIAGDMKWHRKNGLRVGTNRIRNQGWLLIGTVEQVAERRERGKLCGTIYDAARDYGFDRLSTEQLRQIVAILEAQ